MFQPKFPPRALDLAVIAKIMKGTWTSCPQKWEIDPFPSFYWDRFAIPLCLKLHGGQSVVCTGLFLVPTSRVYARKYNECWDPCSSPWVFPMCSQNHSCVASRSWQPREKWGYNDAVRLSILKPHWGHQGTLPKSELRLSGWYQDSSVCIFRNDILLELDRIDCTLQHLAPS